MANVVVCKNNATFAFLHEKTHFCDISVFFQQLGVLQELHNFLPIFCL